MKKSQFDNGLSNEERQLLRDRIIESAQTLLYRKRNRKIVYGVAASLIFLVGLGIIFRSTPEASLGDYVKSAPGIEAQATEGITLILGSGENLNLDEDNASIQYSDTGEEVSLGSGKTVNQASYSKNDRPTFNTVLVPYGRRTDLRLSDGTLVWLNSGSKLIYPAVFTGDTREVYLEGEAIFEVSHNAKKPFKVLSDNQEIEVLGTIFNVSHYSGDKLMNTILKSGSVQITFLNKTEESVKLEPGTMASYDPVSTEVRTKSVNVEDYFSWRDGFLRLRNDNLGFIMTKLSRYYNVEIVIENETLAAQTFSGNLDLKENVEKVISLIREAAHFEIIKAEGKILIANEQNNNKSIN